MGAGRLMSFIRHLLTAAIALGIFGASAVATAQVIPTASLTANTTSIPYGTRAILTWSSTGAATCTALGAWSGTRAISGNMVVGPIISNNTYSMTCTGAGGTSPVSSVTL